MFANFLGRVGFSSSLGRRGNLFKLAYYLRREQMVKIFRIVGDILGHYIGNVFFDAGKPGFRRAALCDSVELVRQMNLLHRHFFLNRVPPL